MLAAETAASTHGNEMGYIPAAMLALIINKICFYNLNIKDAVLKSIDDIDSVFSDKKETKNFIRRVNDVIEMTSNNNSDIFNISKIGEGWVGDEALLIAIYCSIKYSHSFSDAIVTAVNHDGDSDSTGSITGNIVGCYLGLKDISDDFKNNIELKDFIINLVDNAFNYFDI